MEGRTGGGGVWDDDGDDAESEVLRDGGDAKRGEGEREKGGGGASRIGKWEDGRGRCAVTGRRVLGGTDGLRRVMA